MDFIGSYCVLSSSDPFPTPRNAIPPVFHELPPLNTNPDKAQLEMIKNGDFSEIRKLRKMGERRKSKVRFVASACHDEETLVPIALTPRNEEEHSDSEEMAEEKEKKKRKGDKDSRVSIFGIKFGKLHNRR
ncbi:unnamed protein product [Agarophyton chilense]